MSIIDELIVLLDDQDEMSLKQVKEKLSQRSKQTISSTMGRLDARGWVRRKKEKKEMFFKITSEGREEITLNLNRIREAEKNKWDGSWLLVIFNIPEKMRKARDTFRKGLTELGFARIQGDLWVSFWDKKKVIKDLVKELKIDQFCTSFKIDRLSPEDEKHLLNNLSWNEKELNQQYNKFISEANKFLKNKKDGFIARLLVFQYAKILVLDPKFPPEIQPAGYLGSKALEVYYKLRPYCYR